MEPTTRMKIPSQPLNLRQGMAVNNIALVLKEIPWNNDQEITSPGNLTRTTSSSDSGLGESLSVKKELTSSYFDNSA